MNRLLTILAFLTFSVSGIAQFSYTESAKNMGIVFQITNTLDGAGVSVCDFNNDGYDDITIASGMGDSIHFYQNLAGTGFQRVYPGPTETMMTKQVLWADYDNDGDQDLFVLNLGSQNHLYQNTGTSLVNVTFSAGLPFMDDPSWTGAWGDFDRDGYLDILVTCFVFGSANVGLYQDYILRNKGDGTFEVLDAALNIPMYNHAPLASAFMDYDKDLWPDIFIASDRSPINRILKNNQGYRFEDLTFDLGANQSIDAMSAGVGDYNGDGYLDIYSTNSAGLPGGSVLLEYNGLDSFIDVSTPAGVDFDGEGWAANFVDFDNDGDMDLYVSGSISGGTPTGLSNTAAMYDNQGNGTFIELTSGIGMDEDTKISYAHAIGDFNRDGYADIIVNNKAPDSSQLWMHNGGTNNWLHIKLQGTASNRDGIGTWLEAYVGNTRMVRYIHAGLGYLGQHSIDGLFGLGAASQLDSLLVKWPSGHIDNYYNLSSNQELLVVEGSTGPIKPVINSRGPNQACNNQLLELYTLGHFSQYQWSTGETTSTISVSSGTYSVTTTDANGQMHSSAIFIVPSNVNVAVNVQDSFFLDCYGDISDIIAPNINGNYNTILWSDGHTDSIHQNLPEGAYWVLITDSLGCSDSAFFHIITPDTLLFDAQLIHNNCYGDSTGQIDPNASGGSAGYSYQWSTSDSNAVITGLTAGNYELTLTDANACVATTGFNITEPDSIALSFQISSDSAGQGGSAMALPQGGTPPYSYLWSTGDSTASLSNLLTGDYQLTITDNMSCTFEATISIPLISALTTTELSSFTITPNPSSGYFLLTFNHPIQNSLKAQIFNALGQRIKVVDIEKAAQINVLDLSPYPKGWYIVRIGNELKLINLY